MNINGATSVLFVGKSYANKGFIKISIKCSIAWFSLKCAAAWRVIYMVILIPRCPDTGPRNCVITDNLW